MKRRAFLVWVAALLWTVRAMAKPPPHKPLLPGKKTFPGRKTVPG